MSDEIKEIFIRMNDLIEHQFDKEYHTKCDLFKDIQGLLDYITNLQTIEREYSNLLSENAELQQKYDKALSDLVKESHKRIKGE